MDVYNTHKGLLLGYYLRLDTLILAQVGAFFIQLISEKQYTVKIQ